MGRIQLRRGEALEALIEQACAVYRARGRGLILKIPTGWVPVRQARTRDAELAAALGIVSRPIVGVRPAGEPAVDFFGFCREASGQLRPLAFDAKTTLRPSWPLAHLPAHQFAFLEDAHRQGADSGLVLEFAGHSVVWLPFPALEQAVRRHQAGGRASISRAEAEEWGTVIGPGPGVALDLLAAVEASRRRWTT